MRYPMMQIERLARSVILYFALACFSFAMANAGAAPEAMPAPFKATYKVSYRGFGAGHLTLELQRGSAPGKYTYEMSVDPSFFARIAVNRAANERSELEIGPA